MRHKKTAAALSLVSLSALLAACDAITAQHIPSSTTTAFNNGAGLGGRGAQMGMPGSFADGGLGGMIDGVVDEAFDADVIGRIEEVGENTVKLDLLKQGASASGDGARSPGGAADGQSGWISTGESLTLTLSSEVRISSGSSQGSGEGQNRNGTGRGEFGGPPSGGMPGNGAPSGGASGDSNAVGGPSRSAPSADAPPNASAVGSVSDLKAGQIVMVWYKEGSKTVDRIRVLRAAGE
ncbi:hypothetical protein CDO73_09215 [Saccharibacillus sp. O23]|uniref:hypothetical protein n=1 Tax=Saccharibacillus sp. O23 TaxID=2009338 RepID=UPI000B4E2FEF|nr:hypothetical protein [Saccharibacillus sp. O23]OWR30760.1 hypothetical protein CDO73_09215 [Saccharibacillus sp. O23]